MPSLQQQQQQHQIARKTRLGWAHMSLISVTTPQVAVCLLARLEEWNGMK